MAPGNGRKEWSGRGKRITQTQPMRHRLGGLKARGPDDWTRVGTVWSGARAAPGQSAGRLG